MQGDKGEMKGILKRKGRQSNSKERRLSWGNNEYKNYEQEAEVFTLSAKKGDCDNVYEELSVIPENSPVGSSLSNNSKYSISIFNEGKKKENTESYENNEMNTTKGPYPIINLIRSIINLYNKNVNRKRSKRSKIRKS